MKFVLNEVFPVNFIWRRKKSRVHATKMLGNTLTDTSVTTAVPDKYFFFFFLPMLLFIFSSSSLFLLLPFFIYFALIVTYILHLLYVLNIFSV